MSFLVRNARGREVSVRSDIGPELLECGRRLTTELEQDSEVTGVVACGSYCDSALDAFSDLDLLVFTTDKAACEKSIHESCRRLGGQSDDDAISIHFPLDSPGYLFGDLYLEPRALTTKEIEEELEGILACKVTDRGRMSTLQNGQVLFDRNGETTALVHRVRATQVTRQYADWFTSIALDIPLKLLIHAVQRADYPYAVHWLNRLYYDCVQVIFARNGRFFPGMKRTLIRTLPELHEVPVGFIEFWQDVFSRGVSDWQTVIHRAQDLVSSFKGRRFESAPR